MKKKESRKVAENDSLDKRNGIEKHKKPVRDGLFEWPSETPSLIGSKCKLCGEKFFPQRHICPSCFQEGTLEKIHLSRRGKLYTFCILERGPVGFDPPYAVGYIDLPEGLRIYSILTESDIKKLQIGMEMELVIENIRKTSERDEIIGYKFKPIFNEV